MADRKSPSSVALRLVGELCVIVVGVTVALWAENWRQDREDHRFEALYIERLAEDMRRDQATIETIVTESRATADAARVVLGFLDRPSELRDDPMKVLEALAFTALMRDNLLNTGTYDELVSSGRLVLVRDPDLRANISGYYRQAARRIEDLSLRPRDLLPFVNRVLPPGYTREAQQCGMRNRGLIPVTVPCLEPELSPEQAELALRVLASSPESRGHMADALWWARHVELPFLGQGARNADLRARLDEALDP